MDKLPQGLEATAVGQTELSGVDGLAGELTIRGYAIEELAGRASYEEAAYLLWHGHLPGAQALLSFGQELAQHRQLHPATLDLLKSAAAERLPAMDAVVMAAGTLGLGVSPDAVPLAVVARFPALVAAYWRLLNGLAPVEPRDGLGHTANYLYMLDGAVPSSARMHALETYLVTLIDHGLNASTFAARVIMSTQSDLIPAVAGAVGALKGPLHGGAPGPTLQMVLDIGTPDNAEAVIRDRLARGERLMGFGHRDYKVRDPRTYVLAAAAEAVLRAEGCAATYDLARRVEDVAVRLLAEHKPGRNLYANVEFYASLLMHGVGLPADLFTPTFAVARTAGWVAHCLEQQRNNRMMQPQTVYAGPSGRRWAPLEERKLNHEETKNTKDMKDQKGKKGNE